MFPTEEAWMVNPQRKRRKRRARKARRRLHKGVKTMARRRRKKVVIISNPKRRRRRTSRKRSRSRRRRHAAVVMANPRRRRGGRRRSMRRSRRSYRRNPGLPSTGFIMDAAYVTGGFFVTRMAVGYVMPYLPMADQPIVRIAAKGGIAYGLGWLGGRFLGQRSGQLLMLGGLVEALSDAVRTYVSPYVPALADSGMGSYPTLLSSYPTLSGWGEYSDPYAVNGSHDEAL